jgi:hypothetical protein
MVKTRDVRLTWEQLVVAHTAVQERRRALEKRLERSSYEGKPGMKSAVVKELAEARELERVFEHNREALRRQQANAITEKLGLGVS